MTISTLGFEVPTAVTLNVTEDTLTAELGDGRTVSVPLCWYPRLVHATPEERNNWEIHAAGQHIHWPDLDEDLSVEMFLTGSKSGESHDSFKRWLEAKKAGLPVTIHEIRPSRQGERVLKHPRA